MMWSETWPDAPGWYWTIDFIVSPEHSYMSAQYYDGAYWERTTDECPPLVWTVPIDGVPEITDREDECLRRIYQEMLDNDSGEW